MRKRILCFMIMLAALLSTGVSTVFAEAQLDYVTDEAGLLTEDEAAQLEQKAEMVSKEYGVGVYIVTVEDYQEYSTEDVYTATYTLYHKYTMGEGDGREGIMLLLSMEDRKWSMFCYGNNCQYAFNEYGQEQLEDVFLDNFEDDDWYGGFEDYIGECEVYLQKAAAGDPVQKSATGYLVVAVVGSLVIALIVVIGVWASMDNVEKQENANAYATRDINLTEKSDVFTHQTQERYEVSSDKDSKSHSGGGGSGRSGSF